MLLDTVHKMFQSEDLLSNTTRQAFMDRSLLTLLWHCSLDALREFFGKIIVQAMDTLNSRFTKVRITLVCFRIGEGLVTYWCGYVTIPSMGTGMDVLLAGVVSLSCYSVFCLVYSSISMT